MENVASCISVFMYLLFKIMFLSLSVIQESWEEATM